MLASDLDAFAQVLDQGAAGELFANEDADALAAAAVRLLGDPERRAELRERGSAHVRRFDWSTVGADILAVYETVTDGAGRRRPTDERTGRLRPTRAAGCARRLRPPPLPVERPGEPVRASPATCRGRHHRCRGAAAARGTRSPPTAERSGPVALPPVTAPSSGSPWRSSRSAST